MSAQPLTYESVLELIREEHQEFRRSLKEQGAEFDRRMEEQRAESARIEKETNRKIGDLTGRIGRMVEHMIGGRILEKISSIRLRSGLLHTQSFF